MTDPGLVVAVVVGVIQGVFEWLPISSEGNVALFLTVFTSASPETAVRLSLFLHAGTAVSATAYYRKELVELARGLGDWRPGFSSGGNADTSFFVFATLISVVVAAVSYALLIQVVTELAGGVFVAVIGLLLILTGVVQGTAESVDLGTRDIPDSWDALLVGVLQGLAVLPGVSRSGTTVSALLLRGVDAESSLRLSFVLSIPASLGAGVLAATQSETLSVAAGVLALLVSAVVGYLTIDALMWLVERVAFWSVCILLGALAILGGATVLIL